MQMSKIGSEQKERLIEVKSKSSMRGGSLGSRVASLIALW